MESFGKDLIKTQNLHRQKRTVNVYMLPAMQWGFWLGWKQFETENQPVTEELIRQGI